MAQFSPIHRDPESDGDDFGCVGSQATKGNCAVAGLVEEISGYLTAGRFRDGQQFLSFVREELELIAEKFDCGCLDTIVKENVFAILVVAIAEAGLTDFDWMMIYGW